MIHRHELRIDVSAAVPFDEAELAVTLVVPGGELVGPCPLALGFPGGGYSRGYWDIDWPGGYSQAAHHAERGWVFAAVDHLGVGDSSQPDPAALTFELLAAANDAATRSIGDGLRAGTLVEGLGPIDLSVVLGMGQSMGGCLSIVAQGRHATFDGLAVLGYSGIHTTLPSPTGGIEVDAVARGEIDPDALTRSSEQLQAIDAFSWAFHWEDVEPALLAADLGEGFPMRLGTPPPWGSASIPPAAVSMLTAGVVADEAAAITAPVFIGVGERDVCPDPWAEPTAYRGATDVSLLVVRAMAHMHNFASTRTRLWQRLHAWGEMLAAG